MYAPNPSYGASTTVAFVVATHDWLFPDFWLSQFSREQGIECVAMGAIIASAACIRSFERYKTRHANRQRSAPFPLFTLAASGAALASCPLTLVLIGTREPLAATACGVAALTSVMIIRRFDLGAWGITGITISVAGAAALLVAAQPTEHDRSVLLAFANTGAGTFAAIAPIYREMDDPPSGLAARTTGATLAIELGRPMFWLIAAVMVVSILILLKDSLKRGRDSLYPAMEASCLITLLLLAFINAGLLGNAPGLLAAVALGPAIAQRKSRSTEPL